MVPAYSRQCREADRRSVVPLRQGNRWLEADLSEQTAPPLGRQVTTVVGDKAPRADSPPSVLVRLISWGVEDTPFGLALIV